VLVTGWQWVGMGFATVLTSRASWPSIQWYITSLAQPVMPSMKANEAEKSIDHLLNFLTFGGLFGKPDYQFFCDLYSNS
jgi:hypothetical protein